MKKKIIEVTEEEHDKNVSDYVKELLKLRNRYATKVLIEAYAVNTMTMVITDLLN